MRRIAALAGLLPQCFSNSVGSEACKIRPSSSTALALTTLYALNRRESQSGALRGLVSDIADVAR